MGNINSLFTKNPSEILPVEAYLSDLSCDSIENLGSTRFMKVAKGKTLEGFFVYKVYVRQDDASLEPFPQRIIEIRKSLSRAPNCCAIKKVLIKPKYAVMLRDYQKHTLFDRISTRPFLVQPEKVWYIYQLFKALSQCEAVGVCHGDLKSQNVLISSSNWLQITDFAPFKPSFLPQDNPSSFTFFFDTSRRQSCYIAPERFISSTEYDKCFANEKDKWLFGSLKPSMDIFSAGCIVYEILCDGRSPFTYSQLCEYRAMKNAEAAATLARILQDVPHQFRPLLKMLLNREPTLRLSANAVLSGAAFSFPPILENFIFKYLDVFRPIYGSPTPHSSENADEFSQPSEFSYMEPDDVIAKLKREKNVWWSKLAASEDTKPYSVLFVTLITANLRALRTIQSKTDAMSMLVDLCALCEPNVAIERALPYLVHCMNDPETQIRATAVNMIAKILEPISPKTYEESLTFVDYLFPEISALLTDDCPQHIAFAIATSLGSLAESAYRFLLAGRDIRSGSCDEDLSLAENATTSSDNHQQGFSEDSEALNIGVSAIFSSLCSRDPMVKRCLVEPQSLHKLYTFFSKVGNGDSLLTFLITFLNAKSEWRLRAAFFDSLPICVQKKSVGMVPLIQQGLQDFEEQVIMRALGCVYLLIRNGTLDNNSIKDLLEDVIPFLVHPNEWLRGSACEILLAIDQKWHMADIHVKLLPKIRPFIQESKKSMLTLKSRSYLLSCLIEPIPRNIWDRVTEMSLESTNKLVSLLEDHFCKEKTFDTNDQWFLRLFKKTDEGLVARHDVRKRAPHESGAEVMTVESTKRLLAALFSFRHLLLKMAETRCTAGLESLLTKQHGVIDLSSDAYNEVRRKIFEYGSENVANQKMVLYKPFGIDSRDTLLADSEVAFEEERTVTGVGGPQLRNSIFDTQINEMLAHFNDLFMKNVTSKSAVEASASTTRKQRNSVTGTILSHMHEHSAVITKLSANRDKSLFASGSMDGSVRIWKTSRILGEGYGAAMSEHFWIPADGKRDPVQSVGWCDNYVCAASQDGFVRWADIANGGVKLATYVNIPENEGYPVDVHLHGPICFVRTHHGVMYGLDLRVGATSGPLKRHDVWRKKLKDERGLVTCSTIDPWQQAWMVLGTTANHRNMLLYDLRFREEACSWKAPHELLRPIAMWANTTTSRSSPEVLVSFNMYGEVSSMELSMKPARKKVLWIGGSQLLRYEQRSPESNLQTKALCVCDDTDTIYTGDSRGTLRKWDMHKINGCSVLCEPPRGRTPYRTMFDEKTENDVHVYYERKIVDTDAKEVRRIVPIDSKPSTYHRTPICDMITLAPNILVSASADGVIKVWK
ncbi:unnamed protein product [Caenorhabditis bovis]|uniref:non-specific serine/threonine protein kinase n=1 Tax=Caenorhabditis bovis TaxID=2654633 RepID=A0A8S1FDX6_9PELO|nr:unnamed protein product [Caenorhabditis bovis]